MRPTRTKTPGSDPVTAAQQLSPAKYQQVSRSAGQQVSRSAGQQVSRSAGQQVSRSAGQQVSRSAEFYDKSGRAPPVGVMVGTGNLATPRESGHDGNTCTRV